MRLIQFRWTQPQLKVLYSWEKVETHARSLPPGTYPFLILLENEKGTSTREYGGAYCVHEGEAPAPFLDNLKQYIRIAAGEEPSPEDFDTPDPAEHAFLCVSTDTARMICRNWESFWAEP